jgi:hypothetical protein
MNRPWCLPVRHAAAEIGLGHRPQAHRLTHTGVDPVPRAVWHLNFKGVRKLVVLQPNGQVGPWHWSAPPTNRPGFEQPCLRAACLARHSTEKEKTMESISNNPEQKRKMKLAALEGRKYQKNKLEVELDHFIQTHQDTIAVKHQLAIVDEEIARLEEDLHKA